MYQTFGCKLCACTVDLAFKHMYIYVTGTEKTDNFVIIPHKALPRSRSRDFAVSTPWCNTVSYVASPHASFGILLRFFGPCQCSSKDGKRSSVPFVIIVSGRRNIRSTCAGAYVLCIVHVTS